MRRGGGWQGGGRTGVCRNDTAGEGVDKILEFLVKLVLGISYNQHHYPQED